MDRQRRDALKTCGGVGIWAALAASGLLTPTSGHAARDKPLFEAMSIGAALAALGAEEVQETEHVRLDVAAVVEDGRAVPIGVVSTLAHTERIVILVEDNLYKVAASFALSDAMEPNVYTRVKMNDSSTVHALVRADGRFYASRRHVRVVVGGCAA